MPFEITLADPPWPQNARRNTKTRFGGGARGHYPTMTLDEIKRLPVAEIAARDAVLFLWVTGPKLQDGMEVIKAWGFRYSTLGFTWTKLNPKNGRLFFGVGYYAKSNAELCLLATRGRPIKPAVNTVSSAILAPRSRHSAKPAEVMERIEQMYPTQSKVELFARVPRDGWLAIGNEIDGEDIQMAMLRMTEAGERAAG